MCSTGGSSGGLFVCREKKSSNISDEFMLIDNRTRTKSDGKGSRDGKLWRVMIPHPLNGTDAQMIVIIAEGRK